MCWLMEGQKQYLTKGIQHASCSLSFKALYFSFSIFGELHGWVLFFVEPPLSCLSFDPLLSLAAQ